MAQINARRKGRAYERRIGRVLSNWWGLDWNASKMFHPTPLSGGYDREHMAGDLIAPRDFPFCVECKNRQSWTFRDILEWKRYRSSKPDPRTSNPPAWWESTVVEAEGCGRIPLLIFTAKQIPDYVMLDYDQVATRHPVVATFPTRPTPPGVPASGLVAVFHLSQLTALDPNIYRRKESR